MEPSERFASAKPAWRLVAENLGMRCAGRLGVLLRFLFGSRAGKRLGLITYHRIAPEPEVVPKPLHNVPPHRFREQLTGLLKRGFQFWQLTKALEHHASGQPFPDRTVVVTFDDGYESVFENAWPVLRDLNIPATIFLNTAYVDSESAFPFDDWGVALEGRVAPQSYRPLTTDQCREMMASGLVELGAHTHSHEDFRGRPEAFRDDLKLNVHILRDRFGIENPTFAFPYGTIHAGFTREDLVAAAEEVGVTCGLTTDSVLVDPGTSVYQWGRFNVFSWDSSATLAAKLAGWYSWAPRLRQWLARTLKKESAQPKTAGQLQGAKQ